ncbi:MAG: hypothetical protein HYS13_07495 [Planctomycetia bacterium]|nr:hypothetical protein [Planctomycetia bacterium]
MATDLENPVSMIENSIELTSVCLDSLHLDGDDKDRSAKRLSGYSERLQEQEGKLAALRRRFAKEAGGQSARR